jgi:uncharacterized protein YbjT (DUF2867 family)
MGSQGSVFVAGGTGYLGVPLIRTLLERGYAVRALVRKGSARKLPPGSEPIPGDALNAHSYRHQIQPSLTFVQLVGVSRPNPAKTAQFRAIDRVAALAAIEAARGAGVEHFVYLSVAQPAPVMKSYLAVRAECEAALARSGMKATILRPWYVLGPDHRWPYTLLPLYWLLERLPQTRASASRLGLVTLDQMTRTLVWAVENPAPRLRIIEVPEIRRGLAEA